MRQFAALPSAAVRALKPGGPAICRIVLETRSAEIGLKIELESLHALFEDRWRGRPGAPVVPGVPYGGEAASSRDLFASYTLIRRTAREVRRGAPLPFDLAGTEPVRGAGEPAFVTGRASSAER
jgi:hypothetical protein